MDSNAGAETESASRCVGGAEQAISHTVEAAARHADPQRKVTWAQRWLLIDGVFNKLGSKLTLKSLETSLKASNFRCVAKTVGEEVQLATALATGTYL